jgi:tetratricopeptide (TPR) repeat protein
MKAENTEEYSDLMSKLGDANEELHKLGLDIKRQELELQKEHEQNKKRMYIAVILFFVVAVIGFVSISSIRSRKEAEKIEREAQLEAERQEEEFQSQMLSFYDKGEKLLLSGDYYGAIQSFQQVDSRATCYKDALDGINACKDKYIQSVIQNATMAIEEERYVDALNELTEALSYFDDSQEIKNKKNEVLELFKEKNIETAIAYAEDGDYSSAIDCLNEIVKFDSNDAEINELKKEYDKQIILANVYALKNDEKYIEAINLIKKSAYINEEELQNLYKEIIDLYKSYVLGQVSANIDSNGYDFAISQLEEALSYLSNDIDIVSQINLLEADKLKKEGIKGYISTDKQVDTYEFVSSYAGNYRFEIEDDNAQTSYKLVITDEMNNELKNKVISASNGATVEFDANSRYNIELKQYSGYANYTIKIYMPNEIKVIDSSAKSLSGTIYYEDQIDSFVYIPRISGVYRFDIEDDVSGTSYKFVLQDSRGESLRDSVISQENGKNVELVAGERYTIDIKQYSGFANYVLKIGIPRATETIEGNSFSGSIAYDNQEDTFVYVAPITGKYTFTVSDNNNYASYKFKVLDSRGESLRDSVFSASNEKKVELEAGNTYTIIMKQYSDFANYTVNISY